MKFDQIAPILIDSITRTLYKENPLNKEDYSSKGLPGILEHYFARNDKLKFDYQWIIQPLGSQFKTNIVVDVNIPLQ